MKWWLYASTTVVVVVFAVILFPGKPSLRHWRNAKVVAVETCTFRRHFDVIDSYDPDCIVSAIEFRNPFRPLSITKGATVQIARAPGGHIFLQDEHGREHKGTIVLIGLMAKRVPAQE
jgi:hypothetical protein